jgi:hypothetical protein
MELARWGAVMIQNIIFIGSLGELFFFLLGFPIEQRRQLTDSVIF